MIKYLKLVKAITFVMAFGFLKGQDFSGHTITPVPEKEPEYNFEDNQFIESIMKEYEDIEPNKNYLKNYAFYCLENRLELQSSSTEYNEWKEAEEYLQKVINQMNHPEWVTKKLRVKFVRDATVNAFAFEDGTIFVNVGFMTMAKTEAELASLLSHEIGHVFLHHNYEGYKAYTAYLQEMTVGNIVGGLSGILVRKLARHSYSNHSVKSEEAADEYSALAIKNSEYSFEGVIKLFEDLKLKSDLYDSRTKFDTERRYFKTHPTDEKRIKNAKTLYGNKFRKNDFLVDSAYFHQLKQRCIDESIYILFRNLQYEDCIELSFQQHLQYPLDKFYLAFLQQSLRRILIERPELGNKRFITNRYVIENKMKGTKKPDIAYSKFYKNKPADFVYNLSIFYNLDKIYGLSDSSIARLENKRLIKNDTLEFINNEDAISYFELTSKKLNCTVCSYNELSDSASLQKRTETTNDLEKQFYSVSPTLTGYVKNVDTNNRRLFVISNYLTQFYTVFNLPKTGENKTGLLYSYIKEDADLRRNYMIPSDLTFNERNLLLEYLEKVQNNLPDPGETSTSKLKLVNRKHYNCQGVFPELATLLSKYNLQKINFLSVKRVQQNSGGGYMGGLTSAVLQIYNYIINCYSIDLKHNTICKYTKNLGEVSDRQIFDNAIIGFSEINGLVAKPTK